MKYILSMNLFLLIISCNSLTTPSESKKTKTDLERENLKGEVILVSDGTKTTFFDISGRKIKSINKILGFDDSFYKDNFSYYYAENFNYSNDKVQNIEHLSMNSKIVTTYFYDTDMNLKSSKRETIDIENSSSIDYNYYTTNESGEIICDSSSSDVVRYYLSNNVIDSVVSSFYKCYYRNGDLVKKISIPNEYIQYTETTYEYSYDPQGNWIEQKSFINGIPDKVVSRQIFYKGQDINEYVKKYENFLARLKTKQGNDGEVIAESNGIIIDGSSSNTNSKGYSQQPKVERQKQWINCRNCNGRGISICKNCTGRGTEKCKECFGKGWKWYGSKQITCNACGGSTETKCDKCGGKGNRGDCITCGGRGQIQI